MFRTKKLSRNFYRYVLPKREHCIRKSSCSLRKSRCSIRGRGRPTHDNNTCRVFASQESHCFSGGSVKLRAYLEIDKRRLQRKRAETDTSVPALIFITQMTKTCSMVCQFPTYSSAIIPYSEPPRRNSIRSPLSFSNVAKYSESVVV